MLNMWNYLFESMFLEVIVMSQDASYQSINAPAPEEKSIAVAIQRQFRYKELLDLEYISPVTPSLDEKSMHSVH